MSALCLQNLETLKINDVVNNNLKKQVNFKNREWVISETRPWDNEFVRVYTFEFTSGL